MKLAVFSDIHGNIQGLEAAARAIEATDLPSEFAQMLREGRG